MKDYINELDLTFVNISNKAVEERIKDKQEWQQAKIEGVKAFQKVRKKRAERLKKYKQERKNSRKESLAAVLTAVFMILGCVEF